MAAVAREGHPDHAVDPIGLSDWIPRNFDNRQNTYMGQGYNASASFINIPFMIQLAYVSTATRLMSNEDLVELLRQARSFNADNALTGMLLYKDRSFLQVLEGDEQVLMPLYDRIRRDPRHEKVTTLFMTDIPAREFAGWSMGFRNLDAIDLANIDGYCDFMEADQSARAMFEDLTRAKKLLLLFRARN